MLPYTPPRVHPGARPVLPPECGGGRGWAEQGGPAQRHHHVHEPAARQPGQQAHTQGGWAEQGCGLETEPVDL